MKKKKWMRKRHQVVLWLLRFVFRPLAFFIWGFRYKKLPDLKNPHLIFCNHQTVWDQFLLGMMCSNKTYFVMTDDVFSVRFVGKLLQFLLNPIPFKKASTDFTILRTCRQVVSEGGSIAIFPEGNRTYSGKTEYIKPSTIKMMKFLKIPVAIAHIEGGYGIFPRWADKRRKGRFNGVVYKVYQYDEYKDIPDDELYNLICNDLMVNDTTSNQTYKSKRSAEYLERVIYNCPTCGFTHFVSKKDILTCKTCNMTLKYNEKLEFVGVNKKAPFKNVNEWYTYQQEELFKMNLLDYDTDKVIFEEKVEFREIIPRKRRIVFDKEATLKMYSNRIEILYLGKLDTYMFDEISSSGVFGRNKMNFFIGNRVFQFLYDERFNAMKFVNLYYKYKIEKGGDTNDKFLGL